LLVLLHPFHLHSSKDNASFKGLTPCLFVAIMPCAAAKQDSRKVHECKEE